MKSASYSHRSRRRRVAAGTAAVGLLLTASIGVTAARQRPAADAASARPSVVPVSVPSARAGVAPVPAVVHTPTMSASAQTELVKTYCATCHSERAKAGGLSLAGFDATRAHEQPELVEKMIRKVRAGMMPPANSRRPEAAVVGAFVGALETRMDEFAASNPNPGWRPFQRLNRAEYGQAVRDLLGLDVDVTAYLPPDTISHGFDKVADVQTFSPALMEGYLRAASSIATLAVGDADAVPTEFTVKVPRTASQLEHVPGAPFGTRGGASFIHVFPADGEYSFRTMLHSIPTGELYGSTVKGEQLEISIDGVRVALLDINPRMSEASPNGMNIQSDKVHVKAGPRRVSAAFLQRFEAPVDDLLAPIEYTLADSQIGAGFGVTTLPHIRDFSISGPFRVTGISDTVSRRRIFSCRPTTSAEEPGCAASILKRLAAQAYRGPVSTADLDGLMAFYERGRKDADFEAGIATAVEALLASPRFVFRLETAPATARAGATYRLGDLELASRLSFFLWGAVPDAELVKVATEGRLSSPAVFDRQVRRMLQDPKAEALATRFASQWLRLQDVDKIRPDALLYPNWDHTLADALTRESQLLFDSLVREDRSILELLTADYSFVNERVARHYGIPNITGPEFRRVTLPAERRGILGHGSVLLLTSVADRTSPVQRGKYVMEVLLGTPPPAPPPNVPSLDESVAADKGGRVLSVRERMEQHRANPACNSCHRVIDPLGLALENFDVTGKWRIKDTGVPVDVNGELYDGTRMEGPAGLRAALLKHQDLFLLSFTEHLMTYALGRRVEPYDLPSVRGIIRDAGRQGHRLSAFVLGVVNSPAFRTSRQAAIETTEVAH